ncbi:LPS-assembly protein LptD [Candidatus Pelagibacter sp. HIMB1542]|uniref:LPS-assembly protein LptD n=1 Tax=Candidatus Pelagibacter sp. HIMB1542 TaxID=3413346 RepID=UPI003F84187A
MIKIYLILLFSFILTSSAISQEQFNFDVIEIEIVENGNKFIGNKKGKITSNNGIIITANKFEYDKNLNILNVTGNVEINDVINDYVIFSEKATYNKKQEKITTEINSKAISSKDNIVITANKFEYDKNLNVILAKNNVELEDKNNNFKVYSDIAEYHKDKGEIYSRDNAKAINLEDRSTINAKYFDFYINKNKIVARENVILENKKKDYKLFSDFLTYYKKNEKIESRDTLALFQSKYKFRSNNVILYKNSMEFLSNNKTIITDNFNLYNLSSFKYLVNQKLLKGEKISINSNYKLPFSDKFYFSNGIINLETNDFIAKDTEIETKKDIFDNSQNDPRIKGVSSINNDKVTIIKKGVYTSCKKNDGCPPWSIKSSEIKHDKNKKEIHHKNSILKIYDIPILYFPKFYHPDPSVKRKSGFLQPTLNNSNVLGSSFAIPYFYAISESSDLTIAPTIFDNDNKLIQNEYRSVGKNYEFTSSFGHGIDYFSKNLNKKKNTTYLFSKLDYNLNLDGFKESKLNFNIQKINNDTFLKVFDSALLEETSLLIPSNASVLSTSLEATLNKEDFTFKTGFESYETLSKRSSDRYQYILPYYKFNRNILSNFKYGTFNFNSDGKNDLSNTNQLKTEILNDISFKGFDYFFLNGFKNNFQINVKNINSVGKNAANYKSSPKVELSSIFNLQSSYPLEKTYNDKLNILTPKVSLMFNPGDMKDHNSSKKVINASNLFSINRMGLSNTFESGKSLTIGLDYKKELLTDVNKFFELKLGAVYRDKNENFIPQNTTLNKKQSNIFGSITNKSSDQFQLKYNFALDRNTKDLQYNDLNATFSLNNFVTNFGFVKETKDMGNQNIISNTTTFNFDENNSLNFQTRRNRKINLTEFYDLVYEYKNDCLVAAIKYNKTFYEDKDLRPAENLFFTITLFPLTTFEQKVDNELY